MQYGQRYRIRKTDRSIKTSFTEEDIRHRVADLIELFPEGEKKVEAAILSMGRLEMQYVVAFLLTRYLELGLKIQRMENDENHTRLR